MKKKNHSFAISEKKSNQFENRQLQSHNTVTCSFHSTQKTESGVFLKVSGSIPASSHYRGNCPKIDQFSMDLPGLNIVRQDVL